MPWSLSNEKCPVDAESQPPVTASATSPALSLQELHTNADITITEPPPTAPSRIHISGRPDTIA
ncbi:hypothetical protein B0I35DRAFT_426310 [Stachybotrys elegans]|uniref:Uncharacterized protein n=1 Tax=Stachybotrys elegans TaxID=80388 RepID=A0A8K0SVI5_9HYPO|nr:hypothetical protein B0I35DRAFT_426310 [Stachybotrys elegans]